MNIVFTGILDGFRALKDKTIKLSIETQELSSEESARLFTLNGKFVKILFSEDNISKEAEETVVNTVIEEDEGKSPSQRLRSVLYRAWEQKDEGYPVFNDYYRAKMEKAITSVKNKLL